MACSSDIGIAPGARPWIVGLGSSALAVWSAHRAPSLVGEVMSDDFPTALLALAHLGLLVVAAWLACVVLLDRVGGLPRQVARLLTPRWAQGLVLASVGTLAVVAPAQADPGSLDGLRLPDRPSVSSTADWASPAPSVERSTPRPREVEVRSGDTLWAIAARGLGPGAGASEVARAVERWHHANSAVIGSDPDVLRPGQVLTVPDGASA